MEGVTTPLPAGMVIGINIKMKSLSHLLIVYISCTSLVEGAHVQTRKTKGFHSQPAAGSDAHICGKKTGEKHIAAFGKS